MGKFCLFKFRITSAKKLPQRFGGTEEVCYNFPDCWQQQAIVKFLSLNLSSPKWFITSQHFWEGRHNLGAKLAELIKPLTFPVIWPNVHDLFLLGMWRSSQFMFCELFVTALKVFTMPVWSWLLDRSVVNLPHDHFHQSLCVF
jgi:hypothetical protein